VRWVVAVVGGLLVFVVVFLVSGVVLAAIWPQVVSHTVGFGTVSTNNPLGFLLGALTATHSFRASLKRRRSDDPPVP
jgi:hypothetical protein